MDPETNPDPQEALDGSEDTETDPPMPDDGYKPEWMPEARACPEGHFPLDELVVLDWPDEDEEVY